MMRRVWMAGVLLIMVLWATACGPQAQPATQSDSPLVERAEAAAATRLGAPYVLDGPLAVRAFNKDRAVQPDTDQEFQFMMVNNLSGDLPVEIVLERQEGERWRTSLCVQLQCILGDGSDQSRSEAVILSPYLEQPFQVHVFVSADAGAGQAETLTLRVEPQVDGVEPRSLTLSAQVSGQ